MTTTSDERSSLMLGAASEDQISRGSTQVTGAEPWFVRAENLLLLTVTSFTRTWEAAAAARLELYRTQ